MERNEETRDDIVLVLSKWTDVETRNWVTQAELGEAILFGEVDREAVIRLFIRDNDIPVDREGLLRDMYYRQFSVCMRMRRLPPHVKVIKKFNKFKEVWSWKLRELPN